MFREKYIKDNDFIKPDDDFLKRLKTSLEEADEKVIGIPDKKKLGVRWKPVATLAACLVLVCTVAFVATRTDVLGDNQVHTDLGTIVSEQLSDANENADDADTLQLFNQVYSLFQTEHAILYEMFNYQPLEGGVEYLQESKETYRQLEVQERDELIGNILAKQYVLADTTEDFEDETYYMAEFENEAYVVFAIYKDEYIYIAELSGVQSMAAR